jgi:effector-binding domain-containing protein
MITATDLEFAEVEVPPALVVQVRGQSAPDPGSIKAAITSGFQAMMEYIGRHQLTPNGQPRTIYTAYGPEGVAFLLAMPVAAAPASREGDVAATVETLEGAKAYRFTHHGPYENLAQTYGRITEFLKAKGWIETEADWARYMPMWEEYLNPPETTPSEELLTYIYLPAR